MVSCGSFSSSAADVLGIGCRPAGSDGVQRRQLVVAAVEFLDQRGGVGVADHRHQADLLALGGLPARRADRTSSGRRTAPPAARRASREKTVHSPAACISGETANHGAPSLRAHLVVDLVGGLVVGADHRRHVGVALPPQHALGPAGGAAGAVHDEVVRRARDPAVRITLRQCVFQRHRTRQPRARRCRRRPRSAGPRRRAAARRRTCAPSARW